MKHYKVARRYAAALMAASEEAKNLEKTAADLEYVGKVIDSSREFRLLLASPVVSVEKKQGVMKEIFAKKISAMTFQFISLMVSKKRENILPELILQFGVLRDEKLGIATADVTSATDLSSAQEKAVQAQLEKYTGKQIRLRKMVDGNIKGGLVVRIGDTVLDASIKRQLEILHERFIYGDANASA